MLTFYANRRQFRALEGLAYWIADAEYIKERFGSNDPEIKTCDVTIRKCIFPELDELGVPFWVQNSVIAFASNWRAYHSEYFSVAMAAKGIYRREAGMCTA